MRSADDPILVIEDHPMMRAMVGEVLESAGYKIVLVDGAEAALRLLADDLAALVTDIHLGDGPDGWAIARRFRQLHPNLPILYMSADAADDWTFKGVPKSRMIRKAFGCSELLSSLADVLVVAPPDVPRDEPAAVPAVRAI